MKNTQIVIAVLALAFVAASKMAVAAPPTLEEAWGDTTEAQRLATLEKTFDPRGKLNPLPVKKRTAEEQAQLEKKLDWFYKAKYGVLVHYLSGIAYTAKVPWTAESWDAWVDAVDVDAFAAQCAEAGIGYVILTVGQQRNYYCSSPNPVYEKLWGLEPGRYSAKRDLPMDLYKALKPHGIRLMLYTTGSPFATEGEAEKKSEAVGWKWNADPKGRSATRAASEKWCQAIEWWSRHYGEACSGWWVDGNYNMAPGHSIRLDKALRRGNPDAIIGTSYYALSDFDHGHCSHDWAKQQQHLPPQGPDHRSNWTVYSPAELAQPIAPEKGRWLPLYGIQWHALQFLGSTWGQSDAPKSTQSVVNYARKVIERGGMITFDIGVYGPKAADGKNAPYLKIPEAQLNQIRAVRDAVKDIQR